MKHSSFILMSLCVFMNVERKAGSGVEVVHEWVTVDYDLPPLMKKIYIARGLFIRENNVIIHIDAYKDELFVSVDRVISPGIPSSVNRVVKKNGMSLLEPFPSLAWHRVGDCNAIQNAEGLEIDSTTGHLWILDGGIVNNQKFCPQKLVIIDINTEKEVFNHVFPNSVTPPGSLLLDLSLDKRYKKTRYAYIPDSKLGRIVVVDIVTNKSWYFDHPSMKGEPGQGNITVNNETITSMGGVNGIVTTSDFKFVYYFAIASFRLWQIPTFVLRDQKAGNNEFNRFVRMIGIRPGHAVGIASGMRSLFFPILESNVILQWDRKRDITNGCEENRVNLTTLQLLAENDVKLDFVDSLDVENGYLWYVANRLQKSRTQSRDFSGADGSNYFIGRIFVGEDSYLCGNKGCN